MRKEVFGFSRKELFVLTFILVSSLSLIIYSSIKLVYNSHQKNKTIYSEIKNYSKNITYLNDLSTCAISLQRNSLNMLLYKANSGEIMDLKSKISKNQNELVLKLSKIDSESVIEKADRIKIFRAGLNYMNLNTSFTQMINDSIDNDKLTTFNLNKMRPAIREFSDLSRVYTQILTEKMESITKRSLSIFNQLEFWLLLIGLMPYIYFLYRVIAIIFRMIFWELFP